MANVNLKLIKEYFPQLKRFIARLREEDIELLSDKNEIAVDANEVFECLSKCWIIVAFGDMHERYDIDIPTEYVEATVKWLGYQGIDDTDILLTKLNMIDDLDSIDEALYQLFLELASSLD